MAMLILRAIRSALVPMTMPLAAVAGIPVLLVTGSRRRLINFCTGLWADLSCALIGLRVDLCGGEHLEAPRPAVFILNHQSNADGFLVAKLIRRDIAFLGKAELSRQPVRGRLMRMGGVILVDRQDAGKAGAAMQAIVKAIRRDVLSAAIFPEGSRTHSTRLGPFRKGAFLTAIRARVPIIPIVIHNSIDAQPKGEKLYRPARIRVDVLPPLDVSQWQVKRLDDHVAEVRQLYQRVLDGEWVEGGRHFG
jgi:putative phosphoserine phosphatase/1-acylglycerol-3-phosphate O-acyltransferase